MCKEGLLLFNHSVVSDSLWPHGLQHARFPGYPSLSLGACLNSCPLSCHPVTSPSAVPLSSLFQSFPASGFFSNESARCIKWPNYWSFSFSIGSCSEYSGLILSDWLVWSCSPRNSQESSPTPQFESINPVVTTRSVKQTHSEGQCR